MSTEFIIDDNFTLSNDRLKNICKYRQSDCCKYIVFLEKKGDFYCVKNIPELRQTVESIDMKAINDNCEGLTNEKGSQIKGTSS